MLKYKEKVNDLIFNDYNFSNKYSNMLVYGLEDINIDYFLRRTLEEIYGNIKITKSTYIIENYNSNKNEINIKESDYHIEFNPQSSGIDKYALLNLIKDYSHNQMVSIVIEDTKDNIRTFIINLVDELNYYAQACLRRNMEKFANITRFILVTKNLSKVSEPIRSRCSLITIPRLSTEMKKNIIKKIFITNKSKEKLYKKLNYTKNISNIILDVELIDNNLNKQLLLKDYINKIFKYEKSKFNITVIKNIKKILHDIYISNYRLDDIILEINNNIIERDLDIQVKYNILKCIIDTNIRINQGKRYLIHLESLVFQIFNLLE